MDQNINQNGACPSIELHGCTLYIPSTPKMDESIRKHVVESVIGSKFIKGHKKNTRLLLPLSDISLKISQGERVGVLGVNGAGKTSLLKVLSGVWLPQKGQVTVQGKRTSLISLGLGSDPTLSGIDNALLMGAYYGYDPKETRRRLPELMDFCELGEHIFHPVQVYSSGMRMRLMLGVATLFPPEILIMDEWISTGDARFREKARERIEQFVGSSGILILASHAPAVLKKWTQRCIWLHKGSIIMDGATDDVLAAYQNFTENNILPHSKDEKQ